MLNGQRLAPSDKECSKCGVVRAVSDFYKGHGQCKPCIRDKNAQWRRDNPEQVLQLSRDAYQRRKVAGEVPAIAERNRANTYGFGSVEAMREWLAERPYCEICGASPKHIDHDHQTKKVRGHLCRSCNVGIGHFREGLDLLDKAKAYLTRA